MAAKTATYRQRRTAPRSAKRDPRSAQASSPRFTVAMRKEIARQVALAVRETDEPFTLGARAATTQNWRDRFDYKRDEILLDCLLVRRDNPLARRIVGLTTQYVVGGGH